METYLTHEEIMFEFLRKDISEEQKAKFAVYLVKIAYQNGKEDMQKKVKKAMNNQVYEKFESVTFKIN